MMLTCFAAAVVVAAWAPVLRVLLDLAAEPVCQRRSTLWPLVGVLAAGAAVTVLVLVMLGTEMIGGPDRPTICDFDEFGCRPTVDRSGPATPQALHAIYILAAIALLGVALNAALLATGRLRIPTTPWLTERHHMPNNPQAHREIPMNEHPDPHKDQPPASAPIASTPAGQG